MWCLFNVNVLVNNKVHESYICIYLALDCSLNCKLYNFFTFQLFYFLNILFICSIFVTKIYYVYLSDLTVYTRMVFKLCQSSQVLGLHNYNIWATTIVILIFYLFFFPFLSCSEKYLTMNFQRKKMGPGSQHVQNCLHVISLQNWMMFNVLLSDFHRLLWTGYSIHRPYLWLKYFNRFQYFWLPPKWTFPIN